MHVPTVMIQKYCAAVLRQTAPLNQKSIYWNAHNSKHGLVDKDGVGGRTSVDGMWPLLKKGGFHSYTWRFTGKSPQNASRARDSVSTADRLFG